MDVKKALLLLHGMGNFSPPGIDDDGKPTLGSFGDEFMKASTKALQRYKGYKTKTINQYIDIHEFNFDSWFDKMRQEMADRSKSMQERIDYVAGIYGVNFATDIVARLTNWEAEFGDDDFFHTHWLDVIFYTTMLGAKVRVDVAKKIAELIEDYGQGNVHIMAHSLGTAVLHDTLHLLYRPEHDPNDEIPDLHLTNHKIGSLWMISNVSRLVNSVTRLADPYKSVVKPGDDGCTNVFYNIRHRLDPFTWISCFNPENNGSWIPESLFYSAFNHIVTDLIVCANTHSFTQYLLDPKLAEQYLYRLTPFNVKIEELDRVANVYSQNSIAGAYAGLEEAFHELQFKELQSLRDFLDAGIALNAAITNIQGKPCEEV